MMNNVYDNDTERMASKFLLRYVQHWGQSDMERQEARENFLQAAGFRDTDSELAGLWLADVVDDMPRGRFEDEVCYLERALQSRQSGDG